MTFKLVFIPLLLLAIGPCSKTNSLHSTNSESPQVTKEEQRGKEYKVFALGADPDAVSLGNTVHVLFSVLVTGSERSPESLTLVEVDKDGKSINTTGILQDNGKNGDVMQQDRIFSGTFSLYGKKESKRFFQAQFTCNNFGYRSPLYEWAVTSFPTEPYPSDPAMLVVDPETGQKFYANEVIVSFTKKTSPEKISDILSKENCSLVGTIPSLGVYQIQFETDKTVETVYQIIQKFKGYEEVEYAEPNFHIELDN